jgi:hypothetical protein
MENELLGRLLDNTVKQLESNLDHDTSMTPFQRKVVEGLYICVFDGTYRTTGSGSHLFTLCCVISVDITTNHR